MSADAATRAVIAGVLDKLAASVAFMALSTGGIFNGVNTGASLPYTAVTASERRFDSFGKNGKELDVRVHVLSEHQGEDQALQIIDKAVELLDDERGQAVKVAVAGYTVWQVLYEGDEPMPDLMIGGIQARQRVALFTVRVEVV